MPQDLKPSSGSHTLAGVGRECGWYNPGCNGEIQAIGSGLNRSQWIKWWANEVTGYWSYLCEC